jgi:hypothetical protein
MFKLDPNLRTISASREQVVALHQSLNSPHLAIPGKRAGPAQAFIVAVRAPSGFSLYIYLLLADVPDCAIYTSGRGPLTADGYGSELAEAIAFVESMGFMMEAVNFRSMTAEAQSELLRSLPMFKRDLRPSAPPEGTQARAGDQTSVVAKLIGRIFSSF